MRSKSGPTVKVRTTVKALKQLLSNDLFVAALSIGTAEAVHHVLKTRPEVIGIYEGLGNGTLTENQIARFVDDLQSKFKRGERFVGDIPLSALAVGLERWQSPFAKKFLTKLTELTAAELVMSRRIAALALRDRARQLGGMTSAVHHISSAAATPALMLATPNKISSSNAIYRHAA